MTTAELWADFNDIRDGNEVTVSLRHCNVMVRVGGTYSVGDGEGNWCLGTVQWVGDSYLVAQLDLTTWHNAEDGVPPSSFVRGNPRLAETLSDPTIAAEVDRIVAETKRDDEEGK